MILQGMLLCWQLPEKNLKFQVGLTSQVQVGWSYGVASISGLLKNIALFCKRYLYKRWYSAKETCHFKEPTNRSHPIQSNSISTQCLSDAAHMNEPWHTYETRCRWGAKHATYTECCLHVWMCNATHINEPCHTFEKAMSHIWSALPSGCRRSPLSSSLHASSTQPRLHRLRG